MAMTVDRSRFLLLTASLATTLTTAACDSKAPQKRPEAGETGGDADQAAKGEPAPAADAANAGRAKPPSTAGTATTPGKSTAARGGPASTDEDPPASIDEAAL